MYFMCNSCIHRACLSDQDQVKIPEQLLCGAVGPNGRDLPKAGDFLRLVTFHDFQEISGHYMFLIVFIHEFIWILGFLYVFIQRIKLKLVQWTVWNWVKLIETVRLRHAQAVSRNFSLPSLQVREKCKVMIALMPPEAGHLTAHIGPGTEEQAGQG